MRKTVHEIAPPFNHTSHAQPIIQIYEISVTLHRKFCLYLLSDTRYLHFGTCASMHSFSRIVFAMLVLFSGATTASAGSVRIELPDLVGDYNFVPTSDWLNQGFDASRSVVIPTQYGFYSISTAIVVVEGTVAAGRAHGDGVLREATEFDLIPSVRASLNAFRSVDYLVTDPFLGAFHIEKAYEAPYVPEITPLPNPDGYPPIEIRVGAHVGLNDFYTNFPPYIGTPPDGLYIRDGLIVDQPIAGRITSAYLILNGPDIVPEPPAMILLIGGAMLACANSRRSRGAVHFFAHP
jgi:hypothetical protein